MNILITLCAFGALGFWAYAKGREDERRTMSDWNQFVDDTKKYWDEQISEKS